MKIVIFDTETTGLLEPDNSALCKQPEIIEFYGIQLDREFNILKEVNQMIKPKRGVSTKITEITGITQEMLDDKPPFSDISEDIEDLFADTDLMVAHNLSFDTGMLKVEFDRLNREPPAASGGLCTVEASYSIHGFRISLKRLHQELLGISFKAHRAKDDVFALVRVLHHMTEKGMVKI